MSYYLSKKKRKRKSSKNTNRQLVISAIVAPILIVITLLALNFSELKKQYSLIRAEDYIKKARKLLEENRLTAARILLRNAFRHTPQKTEIIDLFVKLLEKEGSQEIVGLLIQKYLLSPDPESTRKLLQTAINTNQQALVMPVVRDILERFPNDAMMHRLVGILFLGLKKYGEAENNIQKAISLDPNNLLFRLDLATLHLAHSDPSKTKKAREFLEEIRKTPDYYLVATRSLAAHTSITNPLEGLRLYEEILEKHPEDWNARIRAFQITCRTNPSQAKQILPEIWIRASGTQERTEVLTTVFAFLGAEDALELSNKLSEDELAVPHINTLRIGALWSQERYLEALRLANDGLKHATTNLEKAFLFFWAYRCQKALKQDSAASNSLESLRQLALQDPRSAIVISNQLFTIGQESLGVTFLEIAANGEDTNSAQIALNALFQYYKQKADTQSLVRVHKSIMQLQPENPFVQNNMAVLLLLTKSDPQQALKLAESAYLTLPSNPVIVSNYAHTLATMGKIDQALKLIESIEPDQFTDSMKLYNAHVLFLNGQKKEAANIAANINSKDFLVEEKEILNKILTASSED